MARSAGAMGAPLTDPGCDFSVSSTVCKLRMDASILCPLSLRHGNCRLNGNQANTVKSEAWSRGVYGRSSNFAQNGVLGENTPKDSKLPIRLYRQVRRSWPNPPEVMAPGGCIRRPEER